jgi:glycosyltransferase involved in cell wall biosynthesis
MTPKLRVLHVVPTYFPAIRYGGPIFAVHGLCRALAARGHHVEVFTTNVDGPNDSAVPLGTPVALDGVHISYFPSTNFRRLYWPPPLGRALKAELSKFTVAHLHSVFLWPTWAAARLAARARIPYVVSPRGMLVKELIERRSRLAKSAWLGLIEKANLQGASAIHATSELEAAELGRFNWRLQRVATIANGIDEMRAFCDDEVSADIKELTREQPLILFFGRISWKKGLDRLFKAFALTHRGKLVIVGPDDENMVAQLMRLARELHFGDRVRILPRSILGADKEYLYKSVQLFVLASYSENFGNTVLEAMQRGVPAIVTPEVGAAEIVRASGGGIVAEGDAKSLSAAMDRLIKDPELARCMGEAGSRYVRGHYGWPQMAVQMEQLYESLRA